MADDSHRNGHSTSPHYAEIEEVQSLDRRLGQLSAEVRDMRKSLDMTREKLVRDNEFITDFLRAINAKMDDVLNSRDGYSVLKRLSAVEEKLNAPPVTELPKARARARRK